MTERENILISVEHRYVMRILSGVKRVELRRRPLRVMPGTRVWIYSKAPHAIVTAVATVGAIVSATPAELWKEYEAISGMTRAEFDAYFSEARIGWAILLKEIYALPSVITLAALRKHSTPFHPPQFFMRLRDGNGALSLLRSGLRSR